MMKLIKSIIAMAAAMAATVGYAGFSAPFLLDMNDGTRIARDTETIAYSAMWGEGAPSDATAVVSVGGTTLTAAAEEGTVAWTPAANGTYTLTHKVMSRGVRYGETLTATFKVIRPPEVCDVVAKQRYPWNGLVDITCKVTGISGTTNGLEFAVSAVMPDTGDVRRSAQFWVMQNGAKSADREVHANGNYRLLWDAQADLGQVTYDNMVVRVTTVKGHGKVQLWEGGPYWAETNIGAEVPWEYGYYFWWGDTVGYKRENGKWVATDGSSSNFSFSSYVPIYGKDNSALLSAGYIDSTGNLAPAHDAAHVHWGGDWRMPTKQELKDLVSKCNWTITVMNGVAGWIVSGKGAYASASIFLPAAGNGYGTSLYLAGSSGIYWSSVPYSDYGDYGNRAWYLIFYSGYRSTTYDDGDRDYGRPVRPVQGFTN